jgi:alcohol dehydrogenase (cytochrome c)
LLLTAVTVVASVVGVVALTPSLHWRAQLVLMYAAGQIPDIEPRQFLRFLSPNSNQSLARIIDTKDPYSVIRNPVTSAAGISAGGVRYRNECASCHAPNGTGTVSAPALVNRSYAHGESDWAVYRTIRYGVANTAMAAHPLAENQVWELAAFVRSLKAASEGAALANAANATMGPQSLPVPYTELASTQDPSADWLTYSGAYNSARHSNLTDITPSNVGELAVKWAHQFEGETGFLETSPIVRSGVMYVTLPPGRVMALDAATGKTIWDRPRPSTQAMQSGQFSKMNRGVAILGDKVFVGTGDAHLAALSAKTGEVIWDVKVEDSRGFYISGAPLAYRDMVVTGVGTKGGQRGFIIAYDAQTGKERWRFDAIPGPGASGNQTWAGESWREGGAPTWLTGSYDPETDQLYWGVGNPKPDYDSAARKGDNLYSNSVVALNGTSGKLQWHFQFTPADDHDWDANQVPILLDRTVGGVVQKQMVWANRNGFYYVLNRETGKFITAAAYVRQTWTDGIDRNGRPIPAAAVQGNKKGTIIYPGNTGGTNWWSPSMDRDLDLVFVPTLEQGMIYFPSSIGSEDNPAAKASWPSGAGRSLYTAVRALDAATGKLVWEHRQDSRFDDNVAGGLMSTKTGLVFGSDRSTFFALDSRTGALVWDFETGGKINAAPVTFSENWQQLVVIAAGNSIFAFGRKDKVPARYLTAKK